MTSTGDATVEGSTQTGTAEGGPVLAVPLEVGTVDIRCDVQVGVYYRHNQFDSAAATGTVVVPRTLISYVAERDDPVYLCTRWTLNSVTYYYDGELFTFVKNADAPCALATSVTTAGEQRTNTVEPEFKSAS